MQIKNVVFDIGGVILTFLPYEIIKKYSLDEKEEILLIELFHSKLWRELDAGKSLPKDIANTYEELSGLPYERTMGLFKTIFDGLEVLPQTEAFINKLVDSGINVYYLSNMSEDFMQGILENHNIFKKMKGGVYSADVQVIKPDVEIYQVFQQRYNPIHSETIFLDDLEKNIQAAKDFGWNGEVYHQHNCESVIEKLSKIINI